MAGVLPKLSVSDATAGRLALMGVLVVRGGLGILAVVLAAWLYEEHFATLVLLRPTKEVLLAGGFFVREGDVGLLALLLAAIPLSAVGVWASFLLGRTFAAELDDGDALPGLAGKVLPARRIKPLRAVLDREGMKAVFLGRLAVFPSTLMAAAAGASGVGVRDFAVADTAGMVVAIAEVVAAGYLLGEAYERAGVWLSAVGAAVALGLLVLFGRWLRAEHRRTRRGARSK
jgi:membrane protein DedA with SNARE-associated domain